MSLHIAGWTEDLKRWALTEEEQHDSDSPEAVYSRGVIMAVMVAQRRNPPLSTDELRKLPLEVARGYSDAQELIHQVLRYGDAPSGEYEDLLERLPENPRRTVDYWEHRLTAEIGPVQNYPFADVVVDGAVIDTSIVAPSIMELHALANAYRIAGCERAATTAGELHNDAAEQQRVLDLVVAHYPNMNHSLIVSARDMTRVVLDALERAAAKPF